MTRDGYGILYDENGIWLCKSRWKHNTVLNWHGVEWNDSASDKCFERPYNNSSSSSSSSSSGYGVSSKSEGVDVEINKDKSSSILYLKIPEETNVCIEKITVTDKNGSVLETSTGSGISTGIQDYEIPVNVRIDLYIHCSSLSLTNDKEKKVVNLSFSERGEYYVYISY